MVRMKMSDVSVLWRQHDSICRQLYVGLKLSTRTHIASRTLRPHRWRPIICHMLRVVAVHVATQQGCAG